jgi:predicted nucleic acid-binding Zn ribbon protein
MEETINDSHREGPPSGGFVMESAIRIPSGLHLDSGRILYDLLWDASEPDPLVRIDEAQEALVGLRNLERAPDDEIFEFVKTWGPLGVWGQFVAPEQVSEDPESYRYCGRLIRQLYALGVQVCENGATPIEHWAELDETMSGGPIAEFGARERIGHAFAQYLRGASYDAVNALLLRNIINGLVQCRCSFEMKDGKPYPTISPDITLFWDRRYCDDSGLRNLRPCWSCLPLAITELAAALSQPVSFCLDCKQPFSLGYDRAPRNDRFCSEKCRAETDRARKRKYWHEKGKNLPSQRER